jgi:hypothetical protein
VGHVGQLLAPDAGRMRSLSCQDWGSMARNGACGPAPTVARYRRRRKKRHALYVPSSSWHPHPASTSLSLFRFGPKPLPKCKRKPLVVALALKCGVRLDYPRTPIIKSKVGRFRFGRDKPRTGERAAATSNFPLFYLRNRER